VQEILQVAGRNIRGMEVNRNQNNVLTEKVELNPDFGLPAKEEAQY
jgi:hypothetical protein